MAIDNVLAAVAVTDMARAMDWYANLLGREADQVPMADAGEWRLTDSGWLQLVQFPHHAGHSMVTINVDDIDEFLGQIGARGVVATSVEAGSGAFRLAQVTDPDGNVLTFAEDVRFDHQTTANGAEQLVRPWVGGA